MGPIACHEFSAHGMGPRLAGVGLRAQGRSVTGVRFEGFGVPGLIAVDCAIVA